MNGVNAWKWVGILSIMLLLSVGCCLLGACWGGAMGLALGRMTGVARPETPRQFQFEWQPFAPEEAWRPWLGVYFEMTPAGALLTGVSVDSPAERAGLQVGDVIIELDGQRVTEALPLDVLVAEYFPGDEVKLLVLRDGGEREFTVTLGVFPGLELLPGPEYFEAPPFNDG